MKKKLVLLSALWVALIVNMAVLRGDTPTFATATTLTPQSGPIAVVTADFNGDGKLDVASLNSLSVTVFTGNGTGGSTAATHLPCGGTPSTLAVADLNRDGRPDLIVGMGTTGKVLVFTNSPTGFSDPADEIDLEASNIVALEVGDVNRDGWLDLVAIDGAADLVVLLSDGLGTFDLPVAYTDANPNRLPRAIALADVDRDGDLDVVIANGAGSVRVLPNDGAGSFAGADAIYNTLPHLPNTLALADLNGDGRLDIVTGGSDNGTGSLASLFNNGNGTFKAATTYTFAAVVNRLIFADVSPNGRPEMVMAHTATNQVTVVEIGGTAGSNPVMELLPTSTFTVGNSPQGLAVADLDADGKLDILTANQSASTVSVLRNTSLNRNSGTFLPSTQYYPTGGPSLFGIVSGDFNADGKVDLAAADFSQFAPGVRFYFNQGGFFPPTPTVVASNIAFAAYVATGDFDRDGQLDVVTGMGGDPSNPLQAKVILHPGSGPTLLAVDAPSSGRIVSADFNRDGILDLAFTGEGTSVRISLGQGDGNFLPDGDYPVGQDAGLAAVGDVDNDGALDIVVPVFGENHFEVLLNDGSGVFTNVGSFATGKGPHQAVVGDFNQDGKLDVATVNAIGANVSVLFGDGAGSFAAKKDYAVGPGGLGITVADLNGDGKLDLATANTNTFKNDSGGTVSILYGQAAGVFAKKVDYVTSSGSGPAQIVAADLDNDGQIDLATANLRGGNVSVLLHTGAPLPKASNFKATIPDGARNASQWIFQVDQPSTAPGVTVKIQAATSLSKNADWITLTGTWVRNGSTWTLTTANIPSGKKVYFRVVTSAPDYTDDVFQVTQPKFLAVKGIPRMKSFSVTTDAPTKTGQKWLFEVSQPLSPTAKDKDGTITYPGLKIRIQSSETPLVEGSWSDLPDDGIQSGGLLYQLGANWKRITDNIPIGDQYFRAVCSVTGLTDDISAPVGPYKVRRGSSPTVFTRFLKPTFFDPTIRTGESIDVKIGAADDNGLQSVYLQFSKDGKKWENAAQGQMTNTGDGIYVKTGVYFGSAGQQYSSDYVFIRVAATDNDLPAVTTYSESMRIRIGAGNGTAGPTYGTFISYPASGQNILTRGSLSLEIPIGDDKQVRDAVVLRCQSNGTLIDVVKDAAGEQRLMYAATSGNTARRFLTITDLEDGDYYFRVLASDFDGNQTQSQLTGPYHVFTPPPPVLPPVVTLIVRPSSRLVGPTYDKAKNKNHPSMQRPDQGEVKLDYSNLPQGGCLIQMFNRNSVGGFVFASKKVTSTAGQVTFDAPEDEGLFEFRAIGNSGTFKAVEFAQTGNSVPAFRVGHSWNKSDTFTQLDYGLYWFKDVKNGLKAIPGQNDDYFSPSRPTIIYVHGWQKSEVNVRRRESWMRKVTDEGSEFVDLLKPWKDQGYNVGLFYWNQFASEDFAGLYRVEGKIYRTTGPDGTEPAGYGMSYTLATDVADSVPWGEKGKWWKWNYFFDTAKFGNVNVADLFYTDYTANLLNYQAGPNTNRDLRVVGHSLGTQVISRTMALVETYRPAGVPLPSRMAFFDPAFVKTENRNQIPGFFSQLATAGVALEVYQSTNLQSILGHPDHTFDQAAYQRIVPNWAGKIPDSHGEPIRWYSLSFANPAFDSHSEPPAYEYNFFGQRGAHVGWGFSAATLTSRIRDHMGIGNKSNIYFIQRPDPLKGTETPNLSDDEFEMETDR